MHILCVEVGSVFSFPLFRWQGTGGGREKRRKRKRWVETVHSGNLSEKAKRDWDRFMERKTQSGCRKVASRILVFLILCVSLPPSRPTHHQCRWEIRKIICIVDSIRCHFPSPLTPAHPGVCKAMWVKIYIFKRLALILFTMAVSALITTQRLLYY